MRFHDRSRGLVLGLALAALAAAPAPAEDLTEMGLEDLMGLEVTSVSKKAEKVSDTPAAVYVITDEDIRRSGATSIPEALRLAPGVHVARINGTKWAISIRGFNNSFANKLLVLIDGRSVYTPLFAGVYWDVQDTLLEDVERIEVIRGPGATIWGANAVNGVINVITKDAEDTQGGYVSAGAGTEENRFGTLRWGGQFADEGYFRVYGKQFDRDAFKTPNRNDGHDESDMARGGFRTDWTLSEADKLTFHGDYYRGDVGKRNSLVTSIVPPTTGTFNEDVDVEGWNVVGKWDHSFEGGSTASLQAYVDRTERRLAILGQERTTADVEFNHRFRLFEGNSLIWGLGYRVTDDRLENSATVFFDDEERTDHLFSGFLQDEWELVADRLSLSVGSKLSRNNYSGWEVQPSGRLRWTPAEEHTVWAAASRAVRTPSRSDHGVRLRQVSPAAPPLTTTEVLTRGNDDLDSEELAAYEAGYRFTPDPKFYVDATAFFNVYDELTSFELGTPSVTFPVATQPILFDNDGEARTFGGELAAQWELLDWWTLSGTYSYLKMNVDSSGGTDGENPTHQASVRSFMDLPHDLELDTLLWWVENLPEEGVPSYVRLDVRLGWQPVDGLRLSLVGQNLSESQHAEWGNPTIGTATEVPRGFYGEVEYSF